MELTGLKGETPSSPGQLPVKRVVLADVRPESGAAIVRCRTGITRIRRRGGEVSCVLVRVNTTTGLSEVCDRVITRCERCRTGSFIAMIRRGRGAAVTNEVDDR